MFSLPMIFAAGLLSFSSPCVLPMIPVYLATLAGGALAPNASPRRVFGMAVAFASGLSIVFVVLGAMAASLGEVLQAQRPWLVGASSLMMLLFGLRALRVLRVSVLDSDARPLLTRVRAGGGFLSSFVFGAAFAIGWSPCIGPLLASILTYAATHTESSWQSAGYLAVYAAGFSVPLLVLAALAARATSIVRSLNRLLPTFERVTGAAMILVAGAIAFAEFAPAESAGELGAPAQEPLAESCASAGEEGATCSFEDGDSSSAGLAPAPAPAAQGPHVLEFVSGTCPSCERMRPVVETVLRACENHALPLIAVNVSEGNGRALATRHAVRGTPTFVFLGSDGEEISRLVGETDASRFIDTIDRAFGITCQNGESHHGSRHLEGQESAV